MLKLQTIHKSNLRVSDSIKLKDGSTAPVIDGITSISDVVSPNGYRYRSTFWPAVLKQDYVVEMLKERSSLGTIEHPEDDAAYLRTPYEDASHVVIDAVLKGNDPFCKFALLNNQKGNSVKALVDLEIPVGVSTRGLGDTLSDSISPYIDEDNYALITWDIVNNPNFASLRMQQISDSVRANPIFKELCEAYKLRDSVEEFFSREQLLKEIELMKESLHRMKTALSGNLSPENLEPNTFDKEAKNLQIMNQTITAEMLNKEYDGLHFINCNIKSLPELTVKGTVKFQDCKGVAPHYIKCDTLDIRGCTELKALPDVLIANNVLAQGSGLKKLSDSLRVKTLNVVNTPLKEFPLRAHTVELRCSDSLKILGFSLNVIKI